MLNEKDEEEAQALQELRETARKELEDWYNHHEDTLKHAKDSNRQEKQNYSVLCCHLYSVLYCQLYSILYCQLYSILYCQLFSVLYCQLP